MANQDAQHPTHETAHESEKQLGIAGRMARAFIHSPLSPLLFFAMLAMGVLGLIFTPRQEDPQISVPMVDIFVEYSGASSEQVASLAIDPLERIMSEIPGVKHVYSASQRGMGMVTVEFDVGEQLGPSIVKVHDKIQSNLDKIPPGVSMPLVKPKGIDDVPVVTLTLWSQNNANDGVDDGVLRTLALDLLQSLKQIPETGQGFVVGGRPEQVRIEVLPERLSGYGITLDQVANTIRTANSEKSAGSVESGNLHFAVYTGAFLRTAEEIGRLVVAIHNDVPVYVHDVARVFQGPGEATSLVQFYTGLAYPSEQVKGHGAPAVTLAIAKKEGSNGVTVANAIIEKVGNLKGRLIPDNVNIDITRNYGATADQKVNELIVKLFVATGAVAVLIWWALGLRPALVVLFVIPVVILITVFSAWVLGYTIDRVSLFALIFSIGILVDDAIVVVENIYRRWLENGAMDTDTAVDAVREVGNPTILATFTVIAALLPMGFVSGMMGPYMEPIPALGSVAMIFSLIAAFIFTPWLAMRIRPSMEQLQKAEEREHRTSARLDGFFRKLLLPIIGNRVIGYLTLAVIIGVFFLSVLMFYTKAVTVKMLPLDNKPEFSVVVDMPEGTALPVTANFTQRVAEAVLKVPEVTAIQTYIGTAQPFDFNGMVRHYYLRKEPWQAEVHVQLLDKHDRKRTSHQIAVEVREMIAKISRNQEGVSTTVVEMPPGPPVLQSVVAEVYGPSADVRRQVAADLTEMFREAEGIADVDNYIQSPHKVWRFEVDTEKAVRRGVSVDTINRNLSMAMGGYKLGDVKQGTVLDPTFMVIQVPLASRSQVSRLGDLPIATASGATVPLGELGRFVQVEQDPIVYHKDLRPVEYVVGEAVGRLAAPVYAMSTIESMLEAYKAPDGVELDGHWIGPPPDNGQSGFEWTGEWTVTYETFRDMGAAFAVALILIYILVVWEFGNFIIPAVIMAPIPLTLIGIVPGHMLLGAEFTATSMIGFIALAGIIVRNSILLVDFSIHQVRAGSDVRDAVILSCKTRTRPIMITAFALVGGSMVILFDPIFQGMAISLLFGVLVSTLLTLVVIPLGCISARAVFCPPGPDGEACASQVAQCQADANANARQGSGRLAAVFTWIGSILGLLWMMLKAVIGDLLGLLKRLLIGLLTWLVGSIARLIFRDDEPSKPAPPQQNKPVAAPPAPAPKADVAPVVSPVPPQAEPEPEVQIAAAPSQAPQVVEAQQVAPEVEVAASPVVEPATAVLAPHAEVVEAPEAVSVEVSAHDAVAVAVEEVPPTEASMTVAPAAAKKRVVPKKKAAASKKSTPPKSAPKAKASTSKSAPEPKKVVPKKAARRGIRLKPGLHEDGEG